MRWHIRVALFCLTTLGVMQITFIRKKYSSKKSWQDIWQSKGMPKREPTTIDDLINIDGFDHAENFNRVLAEYASLVKISKDDVLCDVGSGSGPFIHILPRAKLVVSVDRSLNLLKVSQRFIRKHCKNMNVFHIHSSIMDMWQIPNAFCDATVVQSVFQYLPDIQAAKDAVAELKRITKPGGKLYVFDIRDGDQDKYKALRRKAGITHNDPHLFLPRSFWGSLWEVQEQSKMYSTKMYYNAPFSYNVVSKALP